MDLKTLKSQVEFVLEHKPLARDNDITLTLHLWSFFYKSYISDGKVALTDIYRLPREDNIKRIRAKIQNEEYRFLPTTLEVVKLRKISEDKWREYLAK